MSEVRAHYHIQGKSQNIVYQMMFRTIHSKPIFHIFHDMFYQKKEYKLGRIMFLADIHFIFNTKNRAFMLYLILKFIIFYGPKLFQPIETCSVQSAVEAVSAVHFY